MRKKDLYPGMCLPMAANAAYKIYPGMYPKMYKKLYKKKTQKYAHSGKTKFSCVLCCLIPGNNHEYPSV